MTGFPMICKCSSVSSYFAPASLQEDLQSSPVLKILTSAMAPRVLQQTHSICFLANKRAERQNFMHCVLLVSSTIDTQRVHRCSWKKKIYSSFRKNTVQWLLKKCTLLIIIARRPSQIWAICSYFHYWTGHFFTEKFPYSPRAALSFWQVFTFQEITGYEILRTVSYRTVSVAVYDIFWLMQTADCTNFTKYSIPMSTTDG